MYICRYITIYLTQYRNMYFDFLYLVLILSFPLTRSYNQLKMIIKLSHIALVPCYFVKFSVICDTNISIKYLAQSPLWIPLNSVLPIHTNRSMITLIILVFYLVINR